MKATMNQSRITTRIILVLTALLISSGTFAQKSFYNNEIKNVSDIVLRSSFDIISELTSSFKTEVYFEEPLTMEDWMIDLNRFAGNNKITTSESISDNKFKEPKQVLNDWMTEPDWNYLNNDNFKEDTLKMEEWMCCPRNWFI